MDSNTRMKYVVTSVSIESNRVIEILKFLIIVAVSNSVIFLMVLEQIYVTFSVYIEVTAVCLRNVDLCPPTLMAVLVIMVFLWEGYSVERNPYIIRGYIIRTHWILLDIALNLGHLHRWLVLLTMVAIISYAFIMLR